MDRLQYGPNRSLPVHLRALYPQISDQTKGAAPEGPVEAAAKGYVSLVDHALAKREIGVRQVGQSLQQDLGGHSSLEVCWVELVPPEIEWYKVN